MKEIWTIIGVGVVLAGLILNQGWGLRTDFNAGQSSLRAEFKAGQSSLRAEFKAGQASLQAQIAELRAGQVDLQQRVARIEGLLQGMLPSVAFVDPASVEQVRTEQP